ncbi:MAG: dihydropyrimidinase [Bacteriovoracia bacterium]
MSSELLLKNAHIVNEDETIDADVLVKNCKIEKIGHINKYSQNLKVIDIEGKTVTPGGVDPHVHFDLAVMNTRSCDNFEQGSKEALLGGTTTVIDFVTPSKDITLLRALEARRKDIDACYVDYGFHMGVTSWGAETPDDMRLMVEQEGITSFKTFLAYLDTVGIDDRQLVKVMQNTKELNALVTIHAENGDLIDHLRDKFIKEKKFSPKYHALSRPADTEGEAAFRSLMLANYLDVPAYLVHMSTKQATDALVYFQQKGAQVYGETCPQYLFEDDNWYEKSFEKASSAVMSPPLRIREEGHQERLWDALARGEISTVGTDHCPFTLEQKKKGINDFTKIPNGAAGVKQRMSVLYNHGVMKDKIDIHQFVALTSTRASKLFGMYPRKGRIAAGSDADLVVWSKNPNSLYKNSIYEDLEEVFSPSIVIGGGKIKVENQRLVSNLAQGIYIKRSAPLFNL